MGFEKISLMLVVTVILVVSVAHTDSASQNYAEIANKSVQIFKNLLNERCGHLKGKSAEREECLKQTSRYWLIYYGKSFENIPSNYITGNDIAISILEYKQ